MDKDLAPDSAIRINPDLFCMHIEPTDFTLAHLGSAIAILVGVQILRTSVYDFWEMYFGRKKCSFACWSTYKFFDKNCLLSYI